MKTKTRKNIIKLSSEIYSLNRKKEHLQEKLKEEMNSNCPHCNSEDFFERSELGSRVRDEWFECYDCGYKVDAEHDFELGEIVPGKYSIRDANRQMKELRAKKEQKLEKLKKELEK